VPRYNVVTVRALYNAVLIDALSEEAAGEMIGTIVDEAETDTWAERLHDVREVDESDEEAILP
jgi:hypothetical protein